MTIQHIAEGDPLARHSLSGADLSRLRSAERTGEAFLAFRRDGDEGPFDLFMLSRCGDGAAIGRRPEMDLSIPWDGEVSGVHAQLSCLGGEWTIVDDGLSTNGTFVNGRRVGGRQRLHDGDRVRVGRTVIAYRAPQPAPPEKTVAAGEAPALQPLSDTQRRVLVALCRPYRDGAEFASPASNRQIADELFLSVDAVKMHLRVLFAKFELAQLAQNQKRARLAECALHFGLVTRQDIA